MKEGWNAAAVSTGSDDLILVPSSVWGKVLALERAWSS